MPDPNTSATGGFLTPYIISSPPLESVEFLDFLQGWIVGITGLDGTMVRPRWQAEPANIPTEGQAWCAFGVTERKSDTYPAVRHIGQEDGHDVLHRHETFTLLLSFYDLGSSGLADYYASLMRDGSAIPQNNEYLVPQDCFLIGCGDMVTLPTLLQQRWNNRVDLPVTLRREIKRDYRILNVVEGVGTVTIDDPIGAGTTTPFDVKPRSIQIAAALEGDSDLDATSS